MAIFKLFGSGRGVAKVDIDTTQCHSQKKGIISTLILVTIRITTEK